jgi:hypothetical protein
MIRHESDVDAVEAGMPRRSRKDEGAILIVSEARCHGSLR